MSANRSFPWWLCVSLLVVAALACNLPTGGQTGEPPTATEEMAKTVALEVVNQSGSDICALYVSPVADETWGGNWLADTGTIPPGASWSAEIWHDRYDLIAGDCNNKILAEEREVDLLAATAYTFMVAGTGAAGAASGGDVPPGSPSQATVIWINESCAQPPVGPQDGVVIRVAWMTSTIELAESNADHMSFVVKIDGREVPGVQPIRFPALDSTVPTEVGCVGATEAHTFVYWDLPVGPLPAGQHELEVEYITAAQIYDGYDTYPAGSLGSMGRVIQVGAGGGQAGGGPQPCDPGATPLQVGVPYQGQINAVDQPYPANCTYFCVMAPPGTDTLEVNLTGMEADLDMYVEYGALAFSEDPEEADFYSNEYGLVDERVSIPGPRTDAAYYIEVCSYEALSSRFQIAASAGGPASSAYGAASGKVCYPSDYIPEMTAYFENMPSGQITTLDIALNQLQYTVNLPPGTYIAYVWLKDGSIGGSYSQAVPCGLGASCNDHTPLPFDVSAGLTTTGIDLCDWYGNPGDVPRPPAP